MRRECLNGRDHTKQDNRWPNRACYLESYCDKTYQHLLTRAYARSTSDCLACVTASPGLWTCYLRPDHCRVPTQNVSCLLSALLPVHAIDLGSVRRQHHGTTASKTRSPSRGQNTTPGVLCAFTAPSHLHDPRLWSHRAFPLLLTQHKSPRLCNSFLPGNASSSTPPPPVTHLRPARNVAYLPRDTAPAWRATLVGPSGCRAAERGRVRHRQHRHAVRDGRVGTDGLGMGRPAWARVPWGHGGLGHACRSEAEQGRLSALRSSDSANTIQHLNSKLAMPT